MPLISGVEAQLDGGLGVSVRVYVYTHTREREDCFHGAVFKCKSYVEVSLGGRGFF